jgi:hypothetical protein
MRRFAFLAATAIILLAASHPALAESITVTDGFLESSPPDWRGLWRGQRNQ